MDSTLERLGDWMPRQRWYADKGAVPALRLIARWPAASQGTASAEVLLVADDGGATTVLYQVPIVRRPVGEADPEGPARIGVVDAMALEDGATDPLFQDALWHWVTSGGSADGVDGPLTGEAAHAGASREDRAVPAAVLSGEQSNTSIIFRPEGSAPVICKLFRQVHPGVNPDIELQGALADAGVRTVPPLVGTVSGVWRDPREGGVVSGSLAFAQEFFPGVEDAWRVALRSAAADGDFTEPAFALGAAVAATHASLARLFPTRAVGAADRAAARAGWEDRAAAAIAAVPELALLRPGIERVFTRADAAEWPALQRVHGDLHLGQVLEVPERGWVLLDFEGEPLRPITERRSPDFAIRDVAGMLRSFAYVTASVESAGASGGHWAAAARDGFLRGYASSPAVPPQDDALLAAFELDKALYEVVYEARNRPTWVGIPVAAVRRAIAD
jgi:maltokinase